MPVPSKAVVVDSLGRPRIVILAVIFYVLLFICIGVGVSGPSRLVKSTAALPIVLAQPSDGVANRCADITTCDLYVEGVVDGLTTLQQFLQVQLTLPRPLDQSGKPLYPGLYFSGNVAFSVDMVEKTTQMILSKNANHTRTFEWDAYEPSSTVDLFYLSPLTVSGVVVKLRLTKPFAAFGNAAVTPTPGTVTVSFPVTQVAESYSVFELAWRSFFCTTSLLTFLAFGGMLCCGPGSKDAAGKRLPSSIEQQWVWWLSGLLILFNDPFFALQIMIPTLAASAFSGLMTVTFLAVLLCFFLVFFHLAVRFIATCARLQSQASPFPPIPLGSNVLRRFKPKLVFTGVSTARATVLGA